MISLNISDSWYIEIRWKQIEQVPMESLNTFIGLALAVVAVILLLFPKLRESKLIKRILNGGDIFCLSYAWEHAREGNFLW